MTLHDETKPALDEFTPPGTIKVSASALALALEFREELKKIKPDADWILSFDWAFARSVRMHPGAAEQDVGPGLNLTAYERHELPAGAIETFDGVELAIKIPNEVWQNSVLRLVDADESAFSRLTLR